MKELILIAFFLTVILPLLDTLSTIIVSWGEVLKSKYALKISKINAEILEIEKNNSNEITNTIGFTIPTEEDDYDED